jgi:hypothetical protein
MSISSLGSTQSQPISGVIAPSYPHHKRAPNELVVPASIASSGSSTQGASQMAAAVAAALAQLGLTATPGKASTATTAIAAANGTDANAKGNTSFASQTQQPKASPQIQQYKSVAASFSNLAQALGASTYSASSTSNGSGQLTTVFQNLWASMGMPSATSADASSRSIPSLPSFLQALAQNVGEAGVSGLRGVFVDTVA